MNTTVAALLQILVLLLALALVYRPLGDYMARTLESPRHSRVERLLYRSSASTRAPTRGGRCTSGRSWPSRSSPYSGSSRSCASRPTCRTRSAARECRRLQSLNTAVSFVTNTNWQSYSGEAALGLHGADGRTGRAELPVGGRRHRRCGRARSAAWLAPTPTGSGNFWVDLTRDHAPDPPADRRRLRHRADRQRRRAELRRRHDDHDA